MRRGRQVECGERDSLCLSVVPMRDVVDRCNDPAKFSLDEPKKTCLFGLLSETLLCCALCYIPGLHQGLFTRDLIFWHWTPSMPFSILIFLYDECRKFILRRDRKNHPGRLGFVERFSYY